jgi:hypothetical protein
MTPFNSGLWILSTVAPEKKKKKIEFTASAGFDFFSGISAILPEEKWESIPESLATSIVMVQVYKNMV